jgi:hypothetical protein
MEKIVQDLIEQINTLKKFNAITNQKQDRIETKVDRILDYIKDKRNLDRERRF